ncbi:hypothetical protein Tco_0277514 [Tanacetum coccineum]
MNKYEANSGEREEKGGEGGEREEGRRGGGEARGHLADEEALFLNVMLGQVGFGWLAWHELGQMISLGSGLGKRCEKNYSSVRRYVADPVNAYPKQSITKLILKGAVIFDVVSYQFRCALNYSKLVCSFMLYDLDFDPLSLFLSSMPSYDLVSLANIFILCLILKASNQS